MSLRTADEIAAMAAEKRQRDDAFRVALNALCAEHGVHVETDDYLFIAWNGVPGEYIDTGMGGLVWVNAAEES